MIKPYSKLIDSEVSLKIDSNKYSCNECKRRRMKCSRQLPVCASCLKYNRHCLYERDCKTPLTRKHLTEVEEELKLVKQLLVNYIPDFELSSLLQKVRNGTNINDIPEFREYLNRFPQKKRRLIHEDGSCSKSNICDTAAKQTKASNNVITPQNTRSINIEALLTDDNKIFNKDEELNKHHRSYQKSNTGEVFERFDDFQIPQLLPSSVILDQSSKINSQKQQSTKTINTGSKPNNSSFYWDERSQSNKIQPSIIDGKATTEESGYLGTMFSSAVINLVGNEFTLHETAVERHKRHNYKSLEQQLNADRIEYYIDQYFETYHVSYPIIHKPTFMAQINEIIPRPIYYWDSLYYIVAAIGSFMTANTQEESDDIAIFDIAKSKLSIDVLETGDITLVQTLTLMSNYLQKRDMSNSGYNYLGIAVRMALGLRLHKQIDNSNESILDQEMRRRVWWCLYIFDCGQTIGYGRPLGIPCAGIDARLPLNILDSKLTSLTDKLPEEEEQPTIVTSIRLQSLFHLLTNSIYERIITDPFPSAQLLLDWDQIYLERWRKLTPDYFNENANVPLRFKLARFVLEWRYRNLKIIMFRTFLLKRVILLPKTFNGDSQDEYESRAAKICLKECSHTIASMAKFWEAKTRDNRMEVWYSLYFLIPAVLMPLVCLRNDPTSTFAESWRYDIISAQKIIQNLLGICPAASKILDLINSLGSTHLTTQVHGGGNDNNTIPSYSTLGTDESPLSQFNQLHEMLWPVSFDIDQQFLL